MFILISMMFATVGCRNKFSTDFISKIDKEETYMEAPGQLEVTYKDISEIIDDAEYIVMASVIEQSIEMLDGYPQTHTRVQIRDVYKGNLEPDMKIEIVEEGGQENKVMGGIPQMNKENDYMLFLSEYNEKYYICGAFQGRFIIREGFVFQQATEDVKLVAYKPVEIDSFVKIITE